jgi:hypothetical protein
MSAFSARTERYAPRRSFLLVSSMHQRSTRFSHELEVEANFTGYREAQIKKRQGEANQLRKALEDAGIKLDCVATDILGTPSRAMLDALCEGTTDPEALPNLRRLLPQTRPRTS